MSTELKTVIFEENDVAMTRYENGQRGVCVQLNQYDSFGTAHQLSMNKAEAVELAKALLEFATNSRPRADLEY